MVNGEWCVCYIYDKLWRYVIYYYFGDDDDDDDDDDIFYSSGEW